MTEHADVDRRHTDAVTAQCSALQLDGALVVYDAENREAWIKSTASRSVEP